MNMNQYTMRFLDIIKTGNLEQTQYFYNSYKNYININICAERPFHVACHKGYVNIASWLYYNVSEMTIDITIMNHVVVLDAVSNKKLSLDNKIKLFNFLETIYRGIENQWFNIGKILEHAIVEESYDFAQYILQHYIHVRFDEIYGYAYNCFEHACINGNYVFADKIRKTFEFIIPDDSVIYVNPNMREYADYILSETMMQKFETIKI